jgi:hypothetical protein
MSADHEALIRRLTEGLRPVRLLPSPTKRAAWWLLAALVLGAGLTAVGRHVPLIPGVDVGPFLWGTFLAAALTAILAAVAAFQLTRPGASVRWMALPAPAWAAWMWVSGIDCVASRGTPERWGETLADSAQCLLFIVGTALPLAMLLARMLRRACPLDPARVMALGGLASAAAAASVLAFAHPHHATPLDLATHAIAVVAIVGLSVLLSNRLVGSAPFSRRR